jgi:hypothetical protein
MSMSSEPIWADPRYRRFFARAEETIAHFRDIELQPWLGEWEDGFHHVVLALCGVEVDALVALS